MLILSLILCSKNDGYLGNSRWRLETTLNYTAERVRELGFEDDVEIIVTDWGSDVPLADVVALQPAASRLVSFLRVPPALARALQRDSPFPEVLALNAAARRARGQYIGRIDQDTLVGDRFLRLLIESSKSGASIKQMKGTDAPPQQTLFFANRRNIPYRLAELSPRLWIVEQFVKWYERLLTIEAGQVIYNNAVGIWLLHRDLWEVSGGYDERMIFMNNMEIDMVSRLLPTYPLVDLGRLTGYAFYHLDHYHPGASRSSSSHRKVNVDHPVTPLGLKPSGDGWGLHGYPLEAGLAPVRGEPWTRSWLRAVAGAAAFAGFSTYVVVRIGIDRLVYPFFPTWRRRASIAWKTVRGEPLQRWPTLLRKLWIERPSMRSASL